MKAKVLAVGAFLLVGGIGFALWADGQALDMIQYKDSEKYDSYKNLALLGYLVGALGAGTAIFGFVSVSPDAEQKPPTVIWSSYATIIGILAFALIALAFLVPWYDVYWFRNSSFDNRVEYTVSIDGANNLMTRVTIVLMLSLTASAIAAILSRLRRRTPGAIAGVLSAGFLLAAAVVFYVGIMDELRLQDFAGGTMFNRTWTAVAFPMLGWWIAATVPVVQGAQAIVLAYSGGSEPRKRP